jgi:hypothetical protein
MLLRPVLLLEVRNEERMGSAHGGFRHQRDNDASGDQLQHSLT